MVRRPLRPHFSLYDRTRLVEAMRSANELACMYQASTRRDDANREHCEDLRKAIHKLATSLTGDSDYFGYRYNPAPPFPSPAELDDLATTLFNAYRKHPNHKPMGSFAELEARSITGEIEEWQALRAAVELIPNTMFVALKNMGSVASSNSPRAVRSE